MKYDSYNAVKIADDFSSFDFVSCGNKGEIPKRIIFMATETPELVILAFGSIIANDEIDDYSISDNGDRNKILATIAAAIDLHTRRHPGRMIYFRGSTKARTRLYRMAIGLNLEELSVDFDIYAEVEDSNDFISFHKNMEVNAFLIKRRTY